MARLDHDRCCDEVVTQTMLLRDTVSGADLSQVVPTTPDWTLGDLARHVGGNLLAGEQAVRTGTAVTEPERQVPGHGGPAGDDPAALDAWLAEAAERFAETLRKAGPATEAQIWVVRWPTAAWARRAAHDVVVHRADAAGAVGAAYLVDPEVAADAVDEFLDLLSNPQVAGSGDGGGDAGLRGTVHLHATDTPPGLASEWLVELEPPTFSWRLAHEKATVAVRAPVADVLRVVTRRLPPGDGAVEVLGDRALLDAWLERLVLR
ncbi:MAG TPA: maleylpyruvate isomerase family mycothiol-dependent enzyme [Actinomycetota bacterium]|nr:maleylpyruvate isomerase family mycothiol-dependent enzyme [Actinomycetota bacterium]